MGTKTNKSEKEYIFVYVYMISILKLTGDIKKLYTGLFISPSGISDPCGTVAGMVTPKGCM